MKNPEKNCACNRIFDNVAPPQEASLVNSVAESGLLTDFSPGPQK
jgi:hypothetical protein